MGIELVYGLMVILPALLLVIMVIFGIGDDGGDLGGGADIEAEGGIEAGDISEAGGPVASASSPPAPGGSSLSVSGRSAKAGNTLNGSGEDGEMRGPLPRNAGAALFDQLSVSCVWRLRADVHTAGFNILAEVFDGDPASRDNQIEVVSGDGDR